MKLEIPKQEYTQILPCVTGDVWIIQKRNCDKAFILIPVENVDLFCNMIQEAKREAEKKRDQAIETRAELARKGYKV